MWPWRGALPHGRAIALLPRGPFHLKVCAGFAGTDETQTFQQIDRAIESDYLQAERLAGVSGLVLQLLQQEGAHSAVPVFRQKGRIDAANFMFTPLDYQTPGRFTFRKDQLIGRVSVVSGKKLLLGFVLHFEEFADAILRPSKAAQIIAATAFVDLDENIGIGGGNRSSAD